MHAEISRYVIMKSIPSIIISVWYFKWEKREQLLTFGRLGVWEFTVICFFLVCCF